MRLFQRTEHSVRGWRRVLAVVVWSMVGAVLIAFVVDFVTTAQDRREDAACEATTKQRNKIGETMDAALRRADATYNGWTPELRREWRSAFRELAVLAEQNPACFTTEERAVIEARYREMTGG